MTSGSTFWVFSDSLCFRAVGGLDAEKKERQRWQEKENQKIMASVDGNSVLL